MKIIDFLCMASFAICGNALSNALLKESPYGKYCTRDRTTNVIKAILSYIYTFGGGIFRDINILYRIPIAFSTASLNCFFAVGLAVLAIFRRYNPSGEDKLLTISEIIDSIGAGIFMCSGIKAAKDLGLPYIYAVVSGFFSAVGGGLSLRICFLGIGTAVKSQSKCLIQIFILSTAYAAGEYSGIVHREWLIGMYTAIILLIIPKVMALPAIMLKHIIFHIEQLKSMFHLSSGKIFQHIKQFYKGVRLYKTIRISRYSICFINYIPLGVAL